MQTNIKKYIYFIIICITCIIGIVLRCKGFLDNPSMWHDECALAWNVKYKNYSELFGQLRFLQVAPPCFLIFSKILISFFNIANVAEKCDFTLRLIPQISGILSIGLFYLISKEVYCKKISIAVALFLFSINSILIDYSYEFKPYSTDTFCTILLLYIFLKIDLAKISIKKLLLIAIAISFAIWFSLPACFVIAAGAINLVLTNKSRKKALIFLLPILFNALLFFKFYINGAYHSSGTGMTAFWGNEFILPNLSNFLYLSVENLRYFFFPVKFILFIMILLVYGAFNFIKEKKYTFLNINALILFLLYIASVLQIYPFSKRLIIFIIPLLILFMVKPLDKICMQKKLKSFLILSMIFAIAIPQVQNCLKRLSFKTNKGEFAREMMLNIENNLKPDDKIFVNNASRAEFFYYSSFYNIKNQVIHDNFNKIPDENYLKILNSLQKGNYWFFLPYDYSPQKNTINFIKNWVENTTEILSKSEATQSILLYVNIQ